MNQTRPSSVPATMRGVIPYLSFNGQAGAAAELYVRAFNGRNLQSMPTPDRPGRFLHIQVEINGGTIMLCDHQDAHDAGDRGGHLQLVLADAQSAWASALACGMTIVCPFETQFWGDEWGMLVDPFGVYWGIMQFRGAEEGSDD